MHPQILPGKDAKHVPSKDLNLLCAPLDFQIFRSSVNSVKGYKNFGYEYTFHSYGICWTSKTAWLAGVFMVVGDGGKRRQSIVSL